MSLFFSPCEQTRRAIAVSSPQQRSEPCSPSQVSFDKPDENYLSGKHKSVPQELKCCISEMRCNIFHRAQLSDVIFKRADKDLLWLLRCCWNLTGTYGYIVLLFVLFFCAATWLLGSHLPGSSAEDLVTPFFCRVCKGDLIFPVPSPDLDLLRILQCFFPRHVLCRRKKKSLKLA